ncbi:serine hydrolase-like protein [Diretmus argenteus]
MMHTLKGVRHLVTARTMKQTVSELTVPVPWGEMRGKVWGPDCGRPVLCLHGWADNCGSFNTLIPLLPQECRYVAVDLAGHGRSSHRPDGICYTFPAYVGDVRRVVDALQWTKFSIIGHSMGGNIAGLFSALYPEMVDAVVLLDSYGFLPTDVKEIPKVMRQGMDEMLQFEKRKEERKERVYTYEKAAERLLAANPTLSEQSVHMLLERGLSPVDGGVVFSRDFRINLKNIVRITVEQSLEMQSRIQASVLLVLKHQLVSELTVPVPWGEMRGKVWGPDCGRPVLCLHGWADNCGAFNTLIPLLPQECRYVAVDLAGHGRSSHRPDGVCYTFPAYVGDVRRVVDALHWTKFSIIGHSMGGDIAGMFSALYPEMVDALVLLDCYGFLPTDVKEIPKVMRQGMDEMLQFEKRKEERKERVYTYEKAAERLLAANPTLSEQSVHMLLERGLSPVDGGVVFSRDLRVNFKNIVRLSLEQSLEMQSRIQASVLLVLAEEGFNKIFSEPDQRKFAATLLQVFRDRSDVVVTVPGDHHIHLNSPEIVAPFVSDFLQTKVLSRSLSPADTQDINL